MKSSTVRKVNFAELESLSRKQLISRLLGMRQGASVILSRPLLEGMPKERLRVLFLLASLFRAVRARCQQEQSGFRPPMSATT
jgi:hypothetical protein